MAFQMKKRMIQKIRKTNIKQLVEYLLVVTFALMVSCSDAFCDRLTKRLESIDCPNQNDECIIDFKLLFGHNWKYIYIFNGFTMPEDISDIIGFTYSGDAIYDPEKLILLISDYKIVEEYKTECLNFNIARVSQNGYFKVDINNSEYQLIITSSNKNRKYIIVNR